MSETTRVSRRGFLATAAAIGVALAASELKPWNALVSIVPPSVVDRLVGLVRTPESAKVVGNAYLETVPADASVARLVDGIASGLPGGRAALREADDDRLRAIVAGRIKADFEHDHVVEVGGWILSPTEARLYALTVVA